MYNDFKMTSRDIADVIVPEVFKNNNQQYYELIVAFLENIQDSIQLAEGNFFDLIDIDNITNEDVLRIYIDTYISTIEVDPNQENLVLIKDIIRLSKDLSASKGTVFLYSLMVNILKYLVDEISTTYDDLVNSLNNPDLSESEKQSILEQIRLQQINDVGIVLQLKETGAYEYGIVTTLRFDFVEKYIVPFCHPTGWIYTLLALIRKLYQDESQYDDSLRVYSTIKIPVPVVGDGNIIGEDTSNISNIFESYYGHFYLGEEVDLATITSGIYNTDRIFVESGKVYYDLKEPTLLKNLNNFTSELVGDMNQAFYNDTTQSHRILYRVGGTFEGYFTETYITTPLYPSATLYPSETLYPSTFGEEFKLFMNNGLVIAGDRILFKDNWE